MLKLKLAFWFVLCVTVSVSWFMLVFLFVFDAVIALGGVWIWLNVTKIGAVLYYAALISLIRLDNGRVSNYYRIRKESGSFTNGLKEHWREILKAHHREIVEFKAKKEQRISAEILKKAGKTSGLDLTF